jgi:hypothetical protein
MTQFYKLTLDQAIADYQDGLITATGLLRYYFKIKFAPGWKIRLNPTEICTQLGFSRATFYKALAKLKQLSQASINKLTLIEVALGEEKITTQSDITNNDSTSKDKQSTTVNKNSSIEDKQSSTVEKSLLSKNLIPVKPSETNESGDSPDLDSNSYQTFLNSLSDNQRENFFGFCQRQASLLPEPPILVRKWIEHNWLDLCHAWAKHSPAVARLNNKTLQQDWSFHPRFKRWKFLLESEYDAPYFLRLIKNGGTPEERKAFAQWAIANGVVTLPEGIEVDGL